MNKILVMQTDFGLVDGAVAAMYGVALKVDETLKIYDLTHDIPPYNIWEASYRLIQTVPYWPSGSVFVSVVDPGVGSNRKSVVAKTKQGQYIVTPDNGTLTHIKRLIGIEEVREIEEAVGRRKNTEHSYTFHGRDVYAYTGAQLAAGKLAFEQVGQRLEVEDIVEFADTRATIQDGVIRGSIDILDVRFGSLWTNVSRELFNQLGVEPKELVELSIFNGHLRIYQNQIVYGNTFADVNIGEIICYVNSMDHMAIAINQGNFAKAYNVGTQEPWHIEFRKLKK
ncbi:MAG: S-adenosyl-l-methionine hydroxide adenosyltransferase family protein [Erysipelotrichaceae bacterium]|nr:S-adenosyl-l-methionine hydroxide adenosyltransferase family protein [Erysipelotrichaceae bacterium]